MKSMFDAHINGGFLKKQRPNERQILYQLRRADLDLKTAQKIIETDPEWAITVAYHAMLRSGRALLFAHGYLPADGAQHKTVVELTGKIFGSNFRDLAMQFERLRRKRNMFFYESFESASATEARNAMKTAAIILTEVKKAVEKITKQQNLNFQK